MIEAMYVSILKEIILRPYVGDEIASVTPDAVTAG